MRIAAILAVMLVAASPALAGDIPASSAAVSKGQMLTSADRARLGSVVRVQDDGSVAIIFDAHLVTIPASTLTMADGKLTTSLSKREITALR